MLKWPIATDEFACLMDPIMEHGKLKLNQEQRRNDELALDARSEIIISMGLNGKKF